MYQYEPKSKKVREKTILLILLLIAVAAFASANIPGILFPSLLQLFAVFALVGVVMIVSRCLLRRFVYQVGPREDAPEGTPYDLVITEIYGNRREVVCRIALTDIREITRITRENRKEISAITKRKRVYHYTEELFPEDYRMLTVEMEEEVFYIKIAANEDLIAAISSK